MSSGTDETSLELSVHAKRNDNGNQYVSRRPCCCCSCACCCCASAVVAVIVVHVLYSGVVVATAAVVAVVLVVLCSGVVVATAAVVAVVVVCSGVAVAVAAVVLCSGVAVVLLLLLLLLLLFRCFSLSLQPNFPPLWSCCPKCWASHNIALTITPSVVDWTLKLKVNVCPSSYVFII